MMRHGVSPAERAEQSPPNLSADFLTGNTLVGLDRIRTRLLDLTNRNRLLNFRHSTASSLRIIDVEMDSIFRRLMDNEKLSLVGVPEPVTGGELPPAKDTAAELEWNTDFDLSDNPQRPDASLPVLLYPKQLDTLSRKIASAAKTAIEESGANMLYLVFGFLEWYESDDSRQGHLAPLFVVPVSIERAGSRGRAVETLLEYSGEDIQSNLSLVEKMRRDFGLEIPLLEDEDSPESYFAKFDHILETNRAWSIRKHMTLALLSFGKLLMFRDLDPKTWPAGETVAEHPLVTALFEGVKTREITLAEELPIDEPELKKEVPHLIRDADSSQHSALIHALRGQNLVIEGPPGTGKSQTITNLIAAALAKGKTVLFVAEKLAALEVVRRRLDEAGLGLFCLELHSHKTKKGALLADIAQRLRAKGTLRDPRELDRHLAVVDEKKALLTHYAALINKTIDPINLTVFEILWARERAAQAAQEHVPRLAQIILQGAIAFTPARLAQTEQFLTVYAQHLTFLFQVTTAVSDHPWAWISRPVAFEEEEQVTSLLTRFVTTARQAHVTCNWLLTSAGVNPDRSIEGLKACSSIQLPDPGADLVRELLAPCRESSTRQTLDEFLAHVESYQNGVASLAAVSPKAISLLEEAVSSRLTAEIDCLTRWGFDSCTFAEARAGLAEAEETSNLLARATHAMEELLATLGIEAPLTRGNGTLLLNTIRTLEKTPLNHLHLRLPQLELEPIRPLVRSAADEAKAITEEEAFLSTKVQLSRCLSACTPVQLQDHASILEDSSLWRRLFGGRYRHSKGFVRSVIQSGVSGSRAETGQLLRRTAAHAQRRSAFEANTQYRQEIGTHFQGLSTPWTELLSLLAWYQDVFAGLPEHDDHAEPFRRLLLTARADHLRSLKTSMGRHDSDIKEVEQALHKLEEPAKAIPAERRPSASASLQQLLSGIQSLCREVGAALEEVRESGVSESLNVADLRRAIVTANRCREDVAAILSATEVRRLAAAYYKGVDSDVAPLRHTLRFAEAVAEGHLTSQTIDWLLCEDYSAHLAEMHAALRNVEQCAQNLAACAAELHSLSGSHLWSEAESNAWSGLQSLAERALASVDNLPGWIHFLRLRMQSSDEGLSRLTVLADTGSLPPGDLARAFRFVFYNSLARNLFAQSHDLASVTGVTQEQLQQHFAAADKESIRLYSARVAAYLDQREVPPGRQSGAVGTWTELGLILHEINKQKKHIPIRQLLLRAPNALIALKPCFMMGPLSVAQYLAPGQLKFDLVVMDEASQLKPEDAIGALARGGQMVVVGDPKQLPPTSFFQRVALDSDESEDEGSRMAIEEAESILDVASTLFQPVRRLRWHYRSRHHSLIAFSNNEFYQRDLIIFPSAFHSDPSLGVKYQFVADGVCESSRNPREAQIVTDAVLDHMRNHPDETLGVVTMNFEQRELLEELLDQRLRDDPAAIAYQEDTAAGQETLFVKNLENV